MIPWLYRLLPTWLQEDTPLRLVQYPSFRLAVAFISSFLFVYLLAPRTVTWLYRRGMRDRPRDYDPTFDRSKTGTPTMGGLLIVGGAVLSALLLTDLREKAISLLVASTVWFAGIGALDDVAKMRGGGSDAGLSRRVKLFAQILFALFFGMMIVSEGTSPFGPDSRTHLFLPFPGPHKIAPPDLGLFYALFVAFVLVAVSNAINFADGLDGLAALPAAVTAAVFGVFAYLVGHVYASEIFRFVHTPGLAEVSVFTAGLVGACIGFVWFNGYPAQVFMGDTGSMALGGALGALAVLSKQELLFLLAGAVFVWEAASVLIQDFGIRRVGRRFFFRAPVHHGFQHRGVAEPKVVLRFWIISVLCAVLSLATLKLR